MPRTIKFRAWDKELKIWRCLTLIQWLGTMVLARVEGKRDDLPTM